MQLSLPKNRKFDTLILAGGTGLTGLLISRETGSPVILETDNAPDYLFYLHEELKGISKKLTVCTSIMSPVKDLKKMTKIFIEKAYPPGHIPDRVSISEIESVKIAWSLNQEALRDSARYISGYTCTSINLRKKTLTFISSKEKGPVIVTYKRLISTLDIRKFLTLLTPVIVFESLVTYEQWSLSIPSVNLSLTILPPGLMYVTYHLHPKIAYHRSTEWGGVRLFEASGKCPSNHGWKEIPGKIIIQSNTLTNLTHLRERLQMYDVHCIGRYAEWVPKRMLHEIPEILREKKLL